MITLSMSKRILVVTGSRAEYSLLRPLIKGLSTDIDFDVSLAVTGSHLSERFGATVQMIYEDGFTVDRQINIIGTDSSKKTTLEAISLGISDFNDYFSKSNFDLILILGDRYELLCVAIAALIYRIPIAHLHGGEKTVAAFDDSIRHVLTKLSHLHFTSHEEYRNRVIQLGEDPMRVFNVGALAVDAILNSKVKTRLELQDELQIDLSGRIFLITLHPETLGIDSPKSQIQELIEALRSFPEATLIFTSANADPGGDEINSEILNFVQSCSKAYFCTSLGTDNYYSIMRIADMMIGNSSSGIIEAPYFDLPAVNIGLRQFGRIQADNVINCSARKDEVISAIHKVINRNKENEVSIYSKPFGQGGTSMKIIKTLKASNLKGIEVKDFFDLVYEK